MRQTREALRLVLEVENALAEFEGKLKQIHRPLELKDTPAVRAYLREFHEIGVKINRAGDDFIRAVSEAELKEKDQQATRMGYHTQTL